MHGAISPSFAEKTILLQSGPNQTEVGLPNFLWRLDWQMGSMINFFNSESELFSKVGSNSSSDTSLMALSTNTVPEGQADPTQV